MARLVSYDPKKCLDILAFEVKSGVLVLLRKIKGFASASVLFDNIVEEVQVDPVRSAFSPE
jgi:hypothetical protein